MSVLPDPHALYRSPSLRQIEARHATLGLMSRAGLAAAELAAELASERGGNVLVLAGPGNNGGDACEAASRLLVRSFNVRLVLAGDHERLPPDAAQAYRRFLAAGGVPLERIPEDVRWSLVIDGLFGIGLTRAPAGIHADLIECANRLARRDRCPLLALDCPSGLNADTGSTPGPCVVASHTLSFIAHKPGLFTAEGPDHCGELHLAGLDLPADDLPLADGQAVSRRLFADRLVPRRRNSHKGSFGSVGILGGARSMSGAALLAGRAALKLGAGRVYAGLLDPDGLAVDLVAPELMLRSADRLFDAELQALVCGPGLGQSDAAGQWLDRALACPCPLLLDADALNLIAVDRDLSGKLHQRQAPTLLTPHPAEAARLLACPVDTVQQDRIAAADELARRYASTVALKGCGTVIAAVDGRWWINSTGNPGMASAGMGDVLSGLAGSLLAQRWPAEQALVAAVHLHGAAADRLIAQGCGPIGLTASEVVDAARTEFNAWHQETNPAESRSEHP